MSGTPADDRPLHEQEPIHVWFDGHKIEDWCFYCVAFKSVAIWNLLTKGLVKSDLYEAYLEGHNAQPGNRSYALCCHAKNTLFLLYNASDTPEGELPPRNGVVFTVDGDRYFLEPVTNWIDGQ